MVPQSKNTLILYATYLSIFISLATHGSSLENVYYGPVSRAQGGAGRSYVPMANPHGNAEGPMLNPAAAAFANSVVFGLYHTRDLYDDFSSHHDVALTIVDPNKDSQLPGSFTYIKREIGGPSGDYDFQDFNLNLARPLQPNLALGLGVRYNMFRKATREVENIINTSLGLLYLPIPEMGIAVVSMNNFDKHADRYVRPSTALGFSYTFENVISVKLDVDHPHKSNPNHDLIFHTGFELGLPARFSLRAGVKADRLAQQNFTTAGLGWFGPKLALDYAYEGSQSGPKSQVHSVDVRVFF